MTVEWMVQYAQCGIVELKCCGNRIWYFVADVISLLFDDIRLQDLIAVFWYPNNTSFKFWTPDIETWYPILHVANFWVHDNYCK
jgi:hypothetical protein